jgi:putative membrane protein
MKHSIALTALTLPALALLAACGSSTNNSTVSTTTVNDTAMTDDTATIVNDMGTNAAAPMMTGEEFANAAASSDAYEVAAGNLAKDRATSQALKDFGAMMVSAHTDSTAKLKAAAAKATPAVTPDPTLTAEQQTNLDTLKSLTGAAFDSAYKSQQVDAHQKALMAIQSYAAGGDVAELRDWASATAPVVQTHLDKINAL